MYNLHKYEIGNYNFFNAGQEVSIGLVYITPLPCLKETFPFHELVVVDCYQKDSQEINMSTEIKIHSIIINFV